MKTLRRAAQTIALSALGLLLALLVWNLVHQTGSGRVPAAVASGERPALPAFEGRVVWDASASWPAELRGLAHGPTLRSGDLTGHVVVLNFWASWCEPCKAEAAELARAARRHREDAIFLGVDANDLRSAARSFLRRYAIPFPSISDPGMAVAAKFGVAQVPETYVVDRAGRVSGHIVGPVTREALERELEQASRRRGDTAARVS